MSMLLTDALAPGTDGSGERGRGAHPSGSVATRTAAVIVSDWPLLAARDRDDRAREAQERALREHDDAPAGSTCDDPAIIAPHGVRFGHEAPCFGH